MSPRPPIAMPIMGPVPRTGLDLLVLLVLELGSELIPVEAAEEESVEVESGVPVGELPPT